MRKFLRHQTTKAFLTPDGGWTEDLGQALALSDLADLRTATQHLDYRELEIYYSFDEDSPSEYDFTLPLH